MGDRQDEVGQHGSHEIVIKMLCLTRDHPEVYSLLLVISAYTMDLTAAVKPFVSLRDNDTSEIARFAPDTNFHATSIQMVDIHRHDSGWLLTAHGLLGDGKANEYEPIERTYRTLLPQLQISGTRPPIMDYHAVQKTYKHGPPLK